ncbi:hypothetical protein BJ964_004798 [Actinoplanes lobatus]|uniref:Uncharacterized protein n=1 Tax=Actinoplanes lobatus TaxID=113568 RepID=A0A7W7HI93_9ACTN|nr:hypothetical protein [Actinoplanes lobatus]
MRPVPESRCCVRRCEHPLRVSVCCVRPGRSGRRPDRSAYRWSACSSPTGSPGSPPNVRSLRPCPAHRCWPVSSWSRCPRRQSGRRCRAPGVGPAWAGCGWRRTGVPPRGCRRRRS